MPTSEKKYPITGKALTPYALRDFHRISRLVADNHDMLLTDFPDVVNRYDRHNVSLLNWPTALASVRRAVNNPDLFAFVIDEVRAKYAFVNEATIYESVVGQPERGGALFVPSLRRLAMGVGTLAMEDEPGCAYIAYWVGERFQLRGVGTFAAERMVQKARKDQKIDVVHAYIRPENEPSTRIVEKLGFTATGNPEFVDLGDHVYDARQAFELDVSR